MQTITTAEGDLIITHVPTSADSMDKNVTKLGNKTLHGRIIRWPGESMRNLKKFEILVNLLERVNCYHRAR